MTQRKFLPWLLLFAGLALALVAMRAWAQNAIDPTETHSGNATYYELAALPHCGFPGLSSNDMIGALNSAEYGNADWCGAYVEVTGPEGSVVVQIVDECPDATCTVGHIDLSTAAFDRIGRLQDGIIPITWKLVSPETMADDIAFHFKDGSNQWWTAVQVRNHRNPIASFEYSQDGIIFKSIDRTPYNYFLEPSGMGSGPLIFRVTDIFGNVITVEDVEAPLESSLPAEGFLVETSAQFPVELQDGEGGGATATSTFPAATAEPTLTPTATATATSAPTSTPTVAPTATDIPATATVAATTVAATATGVPATATSAYVPTVISTATTAPTQVANAGEVVCEVSYELINVWDDGFQARVTVDNLTNSAVTGWKLEWEHVPGQRVVSGWSASVRQTGSDVVASNASTHWNGIIKANGSVSFGFQGELDGLSAEPTAFELNGQACGEPISAEGSATPTVAATIAPTVPATPVAPTATTVAATPDSQPASLCSVDYRLTSEWADGFQADVTITNNRDVAVNGYLLSWTFERDEQIDTSWNATLTQTNASVSAYNKADHWNGTIAPGESVSFGFSGTHRNGTVVPSAFFLDGIACD